LIFLDIDDYLDIPAILKFNPFEILCSRIAELQGIITAKGIVNHLESPEPIEIKKLTISYIPLYMTGFFHVQRLFSIN